MAFPAMFTRRIKFLTTIVLVALVIILLAGNSHVLRQNPLQRGQHAGPGRPVETFKPGKNIGLGVSQDTPQNSLFYYGGNASGPSHVEGPLDPYAYKVFMMLKTGATVLHSRLPVHIHTTLQRWPHSAIYADVEAQVCGVKVIDILKWMPEELVEKHRPNLGSYFDLREAVEGKWMWQLDEVEGYPGWHLDKYKNVPMLAHAWMNAPPDMEWFIFIDADSYVMQKGLLELLKGYNSSEPHYIGRAADWEQRARNKEGESVPIPFAHGGSGVAVSRGAMSAMFGPDPHADRSRMDMVLDEFMDLADPNIAGDALVAVMLFQYVDELLVEMPWGRYARYETPFQGSNTRDVAVTSEGWCMPYISWHHLESAEVDLIYEYEQTIPLSVSHVTFVDIYRDFIMPYVVEEHDNWNAILQHYGGPWEGATARMFWDEDERAISKERCIKECEDDQECVMWVFEPGHCQLEIGVIYRGAAMNPRKKGFYKQATSGWMIDRIRERRLRSPCDPLQRFENGTWSDDGELSEGHLYGKMRVV